MRDTQTPDNQASTLWPPRPIKMFCFYCICSVVKHDEGGADDTDANRTNSLLTIASLRRE